jgi:O-antigen/teichoic acid export membrane protein
MNLINKAAKIIWGDVASIRMRIVQGLSWTMFGTGSVQVTGLVTGVFISNYLGLEEFGKYGIIISTIGMLSMFAGMAMGYTVTKFVSEYRSTEPAKSGRYIGMTFLVCMGSSMIAAITLFVFSGFFAKLLLNDIRIQSLLRFASPILILFALNSVARAGLVGLELFRLIAIIEFTHSVFRFIVIVILGIIFKLSGVIIGLVLSEVGVFVLMYYILQKKCSEKGFSISYKGSKQEWRVLWEFTIPSFLSNIIMNPANWVCNVLIVNLPNGLFHMGILTAARQIQSAVSFVPMRLMNVTLPAMSNLFGEQRIARYYELAFYTQVSILGISFFMALPLMFFSRLIMSIYGDNFKSEYHVLIAMLIFGIFYILEISLAEALLAQGKSLKKFWIFSGVTLFSIGLFWFIFLPYGALGYAISMSISHFMGVLILTIYLMWLRKKDLGYWLRRANRNCA